MAIALNMRTVHNFEDIDLPAFNIFKNSKQIFHIHEKCSATTITE